MKDNPELRHLIDKGYSDLAGELEDQVAQVHLALGSTTAYHQTRSLQ